MPDRPAGAALEGIELALFDLDGTLIDDSGLPGAVREACTVVAAESGLDADRLVAANTAVWQRYWPEVQEEWMLGALDADAVAHEAWRRTLERSGCTDAVVVDRLVQVHDALQRSSHRLYPEADEVLTGLTAAGLRIGVVTNGASAVQREKLDALALTDRFEVVVISSEVGVKKPDPGIFDHAVGIAGVEPAHAAMIGDHLWNDVEGAQRIGMRGVWIARDGLAAEAGWPRPDVVLPSLAALLAPIRAASR